MKKETLYEEFMKEKEFERIMAQEDLIMEVTEGFCEILENENLKRSNLAQLMGKTKGYISQLLNGSRNITLRSLSDIAYYLGYRVDISFKKKVKKIQRDSYSLSWDMSQKNKLSPENVHVADDYLIIEQKIVRYGS